MRGTSKTRRAKRLAAGITKPPEAKRIAAELAELPAVEQKPAVEQQRDVAEPDKPVVKRKTRKAKRNAHDPGYTKCECLRCGHREARRKWDMKAKVQRCSLCGGPLQSFIDIDRMRRTNKRSGETK